jgi:hypothetical protein
MEPEGWLSCSQEPATEPYPETDESSAHSQTLFWFHMKYAILRWGSLLNERGAMFASWTS